MILTNEQIAKWIDDYVNNYGESVYQRKWEKRYVYLHAPFNNSEDCYHKWLDWVEENKDRLCSFSTFEEILSELYKKEMKGIGPLVRYDTAIQLAFPDKKYPQKVYLSAGAAKGAKALDIVKAYAVDKQVFVDICPDFEKLSDAQIEDFLCIYKSHLNGEIDDKEELGSRGCSSSGSGKSKCCRPR